MKTGKTKDMVLCALFVALIAAGAFIKIPIPVVPFTLQYLFTMMAGLLLGGKLGFCAVGAYIFLGLLGLPIFDTCFAILRRVSHGQSPMSPDRGHIHHRLIDMGLSQKQTVAVLYVISAILGICAVVITTSGEMRAMMLFLALCVVSCVAAKLFLGSNGKEPSEPEDDENAPYLGEEGPSEK